MSCLSVDFFIIFKQLYFRRKLYQSFAITHCGMDHWSITRKDKLKDSDWINH